MFRKTNKIAGIASIFVLTIVFCSCIKIYAASNLSTEPDLYRINVIDSINKQRLNQGLKKLDVDDNLCKAAALIAADQEQTYPNKINTSIMTNPRYKTYAKDYSYTEQMELSYNDILINLYKRTGDTISFSDENLVNTFTEKNNLGNNALDPKLTNGCVAVSSGKVGYKPFAYFIGGVKKTVMDKFPLNFIKLFLIKMGLMK